MNAVGHLWHALRPVLLEHAIPHAPLFDEFALKANRQAPVLALEGASQPVVDQHLATAVSHARGPWQDLAVLVAAATPGLHWLRSYEHLDESPELAAFRDHYSYLQLAGPTFRGRQSPVELDDVLVGFTLQAPNVHYPGHHHEPPELYGIISGEIEWQLGGGAWVTKSPGDVIAHRSHELHAMRTSDAPVLTWVMWPRNPDASVFMPVLDPPGESMEPKTYS